MTRDPIKRIEGAIAKLGEEHEPPAGWQDRVLAAPPAPARRPLTVWRALVHTLVFIAAAALLAAFVIWIVVGF